MEPMPLDESQLDMVAGGGGQPTHPPAPKPAPHPTDNWANESTPPQENNFQYGMGSARFKVGN